MLDQLAEENDALGPFASDNGILRQVNRLARVVGLAIVPMWRLQRANADVAFTFQGQRLGYFVHSYNCGYPPWRMTERALELALVDQWLTKVGLSTVVEIGAVTPYYWPGRVRSVVDPYDSHPFVDQPRSMFDVNLKGKDVLAVSTLEHIGLGDYGPPRAGETAEAALEKIHRDANRLLITVPYGMNESLDRLLFAERPFRADLRQTYLVRGPRGNAWRETGFQTARVPYSTSFHDTDGWANSVVILERGAVFGSS